MYTRVRVNGHLLRNFHLKRGTRLGYPLSPILFAISIEPLSESMQAYCSVLWVRWGRVSCKISLYADDVILYITNPLTSIPALLTCLREFGKISGYKVNETKSMAMMVVGKWPMELDKDITKDLGGQPKDSDI